MRPGAIATVRVPVCTTYGGHDIHLRPVATLAEAREALPRNGPALAALRVSWDDAPYVAPPELAAPQRTAAGWQVDARAAGSHDGGPPTLAWSFGDGSAPVGGSAVSHVYAAAGSYTVTVVATDKRGQTSSATETVFIAPDPPPPPDPPPEEQPTG